MTIQNPYKPGRAVTGHNFYGREAILKELEQDHYRGAYILGSRQIGKTSLLRELERRLPAFYLDVSYVGSDLARWVKNLARSIKRKRSSYSWLPKPSQKADFFDLLEEVTDAAQEQQQLVWLLLDEAEDLISLMAHDSRFLSQLRGATEMLPNLRLVLAGYRSLLELRRAIPPSYPSPLLGGFIAFILPPLSVTEATALIRQEKKLPSIPVEQDQIGQILSQTGGHPFLLQRICNYLWQNGRLRPLNKEVLHRVDHDANNIFFADFELLSELEQKILLRISTRGSVEHIRGHQTDQTISLSKSLQDLVNFGFLAQTSATYRINNQILARWILQTQSSAKIPAPLSDPIVSELPLIHDPASQNKVRILFLAANPINMPPLSLIEELRSIEQALRSSKSGHQFEIRQGWLVEVSDLQRYMLDYRPHIVHFSGHGTTFGEIILQNKKGRAVSVSVSALSQLFSLLKDNIRCVFLNACYSEQQAQAISQHIECVIGMSKAIGDHSAIRFAIAFYQALGFGKQIKSAFELGCVELDLERLPEQDMPKLLTLKNDSPKIVLV